MSNKSVAIVTGASRGLGAEIAALLAQVEEYAVVGVARNSPSPNSIFHEGASEVSFIFGDVADESTARAAFDLAEGIGQPTILINCAGAATFGPVGSYSKEDIDTNFASGLIGTIIFCEEALRRYRATGVTIVNVMSTAANVGRANEAVYCASKWGARGYTESLRVELKGTPNRVIAVFPGGMNTRFWSAKGAEKIDPSKFMDPRLVADVVIGAIKERPGLYVSDLIINRG